MRLEKINKTDIGHYVLITEGNQEPEIGELKIEYHGILRGINRDEIYLQPGMKLIQKRISNHHFEFQDKNIDIITELQKNHFLTIFRKSIGEECRFGGPSFKRIYNINNSELPHPNFRGQA
jgi:hypothetical protein